jgi:DNA-binding NtrC family response regulator
MKENRRILIIDDERPILLTLEPCSTATDFDRNRRHGRGRLKALKNQPASLFTLDLQLPDAEGLQVGQIETERPETQVIILTAHDTPRNAIESSSAARFISSANHTRRRNCLAWWRKHWRSTASSRNATASRENGRTRKRLKSRNAVTPVFKSKSMREIQELINGWRRRTNV